MLRTAVTAIACLLLLHGWASADSGPAVLDLKAAIALANQESPAVRSAQADVDASRARLSSAKSAGGLNLSGVAGYGYVSEATTFAGTPILEKNTISEALVLTKPIYTGGRLEALVSAAGHELAAAREAVGSSKDQVALRVSQAYYTARMARENIDAAKESVRALEASRSAAESLREAGIVTKADVLRADVELASARERHISSENNYKVAIAALKTAIGLDQGVGVEISVASPGELGFDPAIVEPREKHEVAAMRAAVAASGAAVDVAKSGKRLQVFAEVNFLNIAEGAEFPRQSNTLGAGVVLKLPIFDSDATKSAVEEAKATRARAEENLRGLVQSTEFETESARLALSSALARQQVTSAQVRSAEESLRVLQAGYKEGMTPITDVLVAESALVGARFQQSANSYDVDTARVRLLVALGRTDILEAQGK
jgi:outer membrane protein TolC